MVMWRIRPTARDRCSSDDVREGARLVRMTHPLIDQLRFTRSEWLRGLRGLTEEEGARHFGQMNSISWTVGHLAWQEQRYLLYRNQGILLVPELQEVYYSG